MKKILAFCFFPAFCPPSNGGESRLWNFYHALSQTCQVTLLTSSHLGGEEERINHGANFVERRIPKDERFLKAWEDLQKYASGGDLSAPSIVASSRYASRLHRAYFEEYEQADIIVHDFPFTIGYDVFLGIDNKPRVYNAHNCEADLYAELHPDANSRPLHALIREVETRLLEVADLVLYCSEDDLIRFRKMAPSARFMGVFSPHGMTPVHAIKPITDRASATFSTIFVGSAHPPNQRAVRFVVERLAPRLPTVDFHIVGSCLPEGRYPKNVHRHGVVSAERKQQLMLQAQLALNPMESGSGANVKVLDYLSVGLPVLSTPFGMRGIDAQPELHFFQAQLSEFDLAIQQAMAFPQRLVEMGREGKKLANQRYTWSGIAELASNAMDRLMDIKSPVDLNPYILVLNDYDSFASIGGGATRTRGLYEVVSQWRHVLFLCFSSEGQLQTRMEAPGIYVISVPKTTAHEADLVRTNSHFSLSASDIVAARHAALNPDLNVIYRSLRSHAHRVVIEHCYMVDLPLRYGDRFIYSSQNSETELKTRLLTGHPLEVELLDVVTQAESHAVERSSVVVAVSEEDAQTLVCGRPTAAPTVVVRNGAGRLPPDHVIQQYRDRLRLPSDDASVVFLGSGHAPNIEAARYLIEHVVPKCPGVQFHIIGSVCAALPLTKNVKLWGVLDDATKSAVMQACRFALNPMSVGSGSNVKLADYIGHGLFVVTTQFGLRGYPTSVLPHVKIAELCDFDVAIREAFAHAELHTAEQRVQRRRIFDCELSMQALAHRFLETLRTQGEVRKRVLYVAYRYTSPALGGAEANIERFVSALGLSGEFDVDVIAPQVSHIHSHYRFSEVYTFDADSCVPVNLPHVRYARFPLNTTLRQEEETKLQTVWRTQPRFERELYSRMRVEDLCAGLTWGWSYPEGASRWAFVEAAVFVPQVSTLRLVGLAPLRAVVNVLDDHGALLQVATIEGNFSLQLYGVQGHIQFQTSVPIQPHDPRPLAFLVSSVLVGGAPVDLQRPTLLQELQQSMPAADLVDALDASAAASRGTAGVRLTDLRGPVSSSMERFIAEHVTDYDLVVTHNNVFRPAVFALAEAARQGVPSLLVPHAHLDDDYYHFPDLLESARQASAVLAVPQLAVDFFQRKGCNAHYMPAGCDASEAFTDADVAAFRAVFTPDRPFFLVLGRKAGAKGYQKIIREAEKNQRQGVDIHLVLIGPDDDGVPIQSSAATYLGLQSRSVVRGALQSCIGLCNMSTSESFGIVLLEAWLAGKPVIANRDCAAFHDMAVHGENALLVDENGLAEAMRTLWQDPELRQRLAVKGKEITGRFDWSIVGQQFVDMCRQMTAQATPNNPSLH